MDTEQLFSKRIQLQTEAVPYDPQPPFPKNIMFEVTNSCNQACSFCGNSAMRRPARKASTPLVYSVLEQARELGAEEAGFYTTGEPFLHSRLEEFVREAKELGYSYTYISTNGSLVSPARGKDVIDNGVDSIKFLINAGSRETYQNIHGRDHWRQVQENLEFILRYRRESGRNVRIFITYIIVADNVDEVETIKNMYGDRVDELFFLKAHSQPGMNNVHGRWSQAPCYMAFNRFHVTSEGYLNLCCIDFENQLAGADLNKVSLRQAWRSPLFEKMRRRHLEDDLEGTLCGQCIHGYSTPVRPLDEELAG
jgi:pyruvate-formate lyase-activating enzyme